MAASEFARRQLKKHGWTEGSGLGRHEDGRSEPIKVTLKMDKTGVGHDPGKEFTDHWWLRVFNEAAQKIGKKQDGSKKVDGEIKQKKVTEIKNSLYKGFVKSATLTNGLEEKCKHSDSSSEESSDDENNTSLPTLNDIHKFCGGATGHKAARFGIKMSGKLARIATHEKMFEEKLKAEKVSEIKPDTDNTNMFHDVVKQESPLTNNASVDASENGSNKRRKKKHKKKSKAKYFENSDTHDQCVEDLTNGPEVIVGTEGNSEMTLDVIKHSKKQKHKKKRDADFSEESCGGSHILSEELINNQSMAVDNDSIPAMHQKHKKQKDKKKQNDTHSTDSHSNGHCVHQELISGQEMMTVAVDDMLCKSKKRKNKKKTSDDEGVDVCADLPQQNNGQDSENVRSKKRKQDEIEEPVDADNVSKKKRKKNKDYVDSSELVEFDKRIMKKKNKKTK